MLVVTDVDNTVYDWVRLWAGAFDAMLRTLVAATGRSRDYWMQAAQAVHVRRGALECPSLLCDIADASTWPPGLDASQVLPAAAAAYRHYWDRHLTTYAGMRESLTTVAEQGHVVVAYTEGDVAIAATRLARLGLAGVIRRVFGRAPLPSAREPSWCTVSVLRACPISMDFIPREDSKPNPTGLRTIITRCGAVPENTVYVGDHLWRDVVMAKTLGAGALWARYGTATDAADVATLERVVHWNSHDVAAEINGARHSVSPDAVLDDARGIAHVVTQRAMTVSAA